ncbi:BirA family transcriptional regulator, biotin operon repressor / biotin-[acetyl-CoA-carboxylase] ligase [Lachnospiraceae bacterium NE2001]|nr:BirA family transcriptional regulator, biotin operon repressor / biotin-[acetyl-CoA-carboxylase] ligase [Lachnospiraceae bacterium NE2001]
MKEYKTRDYVLKELELNRDSFITGAALAENLGVSRNAIWKAINDLREAGYDIEAVNNKGYRLADNTDVISIAGIEASISSCSSMSKVSSQRLLSRIIIYNELSSTNIVAKKNLITEELDKRIIIARTQTSGKGHGSSRFDSPEGGIYLSIIVTPDELRKPPLKTVAIGKLVGEVISEMTGKKITYDKETNRIYIGKRKVSGILTEYFADLETKEVSGYVIGIGIKYPGLSKNKTIALLLSKLYVHLINI